MAAAEIPGASEGAPSLVFVDGHHVPSLSTGPIPDGVGLTSLRSALGENPALLEGRLGAILGDDQGAFADLNTALHEDGAFVSVAPGTVVGPALHLVFLASEPGSTPRAAHPRTLVLAGRASQLRLVETYAGPDRPYFTNAVTEIVLDDGAVVDHYKLQREGRPAFHVAAMGVAQGRSSRFSSLSVAFGGGLVRNDVNQLFAGEGGECVLNGLFVAGGNQHMDTHTRIDHARPHCSSRELYKGILDGSSRGVFVGRILVRQDAQKTDAQQTNKNLLLSPDALVQSVPQLEILADDVKCKHASTTGQLDPSALFYLRSRGIDEAAARELLTYAFASDLVGRIQAGPVREAVAAQLRGRLPGLDGEVTP
jgi:Fe-S cluster assembly protein SufD